MLYTSVSVSELYYNPMELFCKVEIFTSRAADLDGPAREVITFILPPLFAADQYALAKYTMCLAGRPQ